MRLESGEMVSRGGADMSQSNFGKIWDLLIPVKRYPWLNGKTRREKTQTKDRAGHVLKQ